MPYKPSREQKQKYNATPAARAARRKRTATWLKTEEGRAYLRDYQRKKMTGFTPEMTSCCYVYQIGRCAICTRSLADKFNCDHDHTTKTPRGLLCQACNLGLGYYEKQQRSAGLTLEPYDRYLEAPPMHYIRMS